MTSNKRYSSRDFIIKNLNYTDLKIIFSSDILIYDNWSFNFKQNLNSLISYLDQHKELEWYVVNLAAKKKKLANCQFEPAKRVGR